MESLRVLSREETAKILAYLKKHRPPSQTSTHTVLINLIIFRLSCCCGLRRKELTGLCMKDVVLNVERPFIHIRKGNTKGREGNRRGRFVPLNWDKGTLDDLTRWKQIRESQYGALPDDPFLCNSVGDPMTPSNAQHRWRALIGRTLGRERASRTGIHQGRHTFCTHALYSGRSINAVAAAAGHRKISTTAIYLHYVEDLEPKELPDVFGH